MLYKPSSEMFSVKNTVFYVLNQILTSFLRLYFKKQNLYEQSSNYSQKNCKIISSFDCGWHYCMLTEALVMTLDALRIIVVVSLLDEDKAITCYIMN